MKGKIQKTVIQEHRYYRENRYFFYLEYWIFLVGYWIFKLLGVKNGYDYSSGKRPRIQEKKQKNGLLNCGTQGIWHLITGGL